jgi:glycosyltransferase involved in cell wall biosynthesis
MRHRVLILHYTPPGVIGGVEHIIQQHVRLLTERGYDVSVVAGRPSPVMDVFVLAEIDAARPENARIEGELANGVVSDRFHRTREAIAAQLRPILAGADSVIVHNAFTLHFSLPLTAALWELASDRPPGSVIAWSHDLSWTNELYVHAMFPGYPCDLLRIPAPGVQYVTISQERESELLELWDGFEAPIRVVPNGIDVARSLRLSPGTVDVVTRHRLLDRDAVLLLPVRITRRKNIELGMRAVGALRDRGIDAVYLISGPVAPHHPGRSQSYLEMLKALRRELDLEERVVFLADEAGRNLDDRTVAELYAVSDALLFPSSQEGFGLPILEAGLARIPAIVADIPIFREVGDGAVWTFDLGDSADRIAEEIVTALESLPSRLYRRVLRDYRWDVVLGSHILPLLDHQSPSPEIPHGSEDPSQPS